MGGYIGLDYPPIFAMLDRMALPPDEWQALFDDIQHLEREALATIRIEQP